MKNARALVEGGVMIALAQVLSYLVLFEMPQGGSVTAGSMVPILFYALRWGWKKGLLAGSVYGVLQFLLGPKYTFHVVALLFDYALAFGLLGLAGLVKPKGKASIGLGAVLGISGRFLSHYVSGVVIWATYVENVNPYVYSLVYNASYLVPEMAISALLLILLYGPISRNISAAG